ncbi:hypothetical protein MKW92_031627 [Papaver armeniacum]|nr:hypothetical protein MKW92_031627 [Papaver armeniacum]
MMVVGLGDMPESCVASVLMYLDPPEICKLARLNQAFRGASSYLMEEIFGQIPANLSMKEIYAKLAGLIDSGDGTKEIWLDKRTAQLCMSISAKALTITGIDDRRCGSTYQLRNLGINSSPLTLFLFCVLYRFNSIAYLNKSGGSRLMEKWSFAFSRNLQPILQDSVGQSRKEVGRRVCNPEHIHGWDLKPVRFQLQTSDGQHAMSQCYLDEPGNWVNYHVGDFVVENPNTPTKIKFSVTQIDCTHTKAACVWILC